MTPGGPRTRERLSFERRILLLALLTGLPGGLVALLLLWFGDFTPKVQWTLTAFILLFWWGTAFSLRNRVTFPLQTVSNLLAALREGDFSIRARGARRDDALGELMIEVNTLAETLHDERLDALEATTLLRKIMAEIDAAIFAFGEDRKLRLVNRAGERLLDRPPERLLGRTAEELELEDCLEGDSPRVLDKNFAGGAGRWEMRRGDFRQGGLPLQLLVVTDLSRVLRQEERQAWQRLIRVLGHELRNSLTPIRSIAGSLETLLKRQPRPDDWEEDVVKGLSVIGSRSGSLKRFLDAYSHLARLPRPRLAPVEVGELVRRVSRLEMRLPVSLVPGPELTISADGDQLEQALINLVRNGVDAALETGGGVEVGWGSNSRYHEIWVRDEGPGLPQTSNLFVPFFTTKPGGSGVGLVLSQQIAEAHGGLLSIENRQPGPGCDARLRLPI